MLTTRSRKGEKNAEVGTSEYSSLLHSITILDSNTWPISYDEVANFGVQEVRQLCRRLKNG